MASLRSQREVNIQKLGKNVEGAQLLTSKIVHACVKNGKHIGSLIYMLIQQ